MGIVLPTEPVKATRIDPAILILYGAKKVGKTELLRQLPNCLILDGEKGTEEIDALKVQFSTLANLKEIRNSIRDQGTERMKLNKAAVAAGKPEPYPGDSIFPYRYLALDTIDSVEPMVISSETVRFKKTTKGKDFDGDSVLELDFGLGYHFQREGVKDVIYDLASVCRTLIIISHLDEKIRNKGGMDVTSQDISLSGKLGGIVCAMASAIGYISRKPSNKEGVIDPVTVSFRTTDGITMGARTKHLRGKTFEFSWDKIFIEDPALKTM
jgi:hypothetical protein